MAGWVLLKLSPCGVALNDTSLGQALGLHVQLFVFVQEGRAGKFAAELLKSVVKDVVGANGQEMAGTSLLMAR